MFIWCVTSLTSFITVCAELNIGISQKDKLEDLNLEKLNSITHAEMISMLEQGTKATGGDMGVKLKICFPGAPPATKASLTKKLKMKCDEFGISLKNNGALRTGLDVIEDPAEPVQLRDKEKVDYREEKDDDGKELFFWRLPGKKRKLPNRNFGRGKFDHVRGFYYKSGNSSCTYEEAFANRDGPVEWFMECDVDEAWDTPVKNE